MIDPRFYAIWQQRYQQLMREGDREAIDQLTARLLKFDLAYGMRGRRAAGVAHFSWLLTPPGDRQTVSYLVGHLILWLYGIDGLLDTCQRMAPAYDLHTLAVFAAQNPDIEITPKVLAQLPLATDVAEIEPGSGCSVLTLGHGAGQLVRDIRTAFPGAAGLARFAYEFDREVWAEVTETLWRLEANWHTRTIDEYIAVGGASIAAIVCTALEMVAKPDSFVSWEAMRPAIWQVAVICRLVNDIGTVERDRQEGRANALFIGRSEAAALVRAESLIVGAAGKTSAELAGLPRSETTSYLAYVLNSMVALTLVMYGQGRDFEVPMYEEGGFIQPPIVDTLTPLIDLANTSEGVQLDG